MERPYIICHILSALDGSRVHSVKPKERMHM